MSFAGKIMIVLSISVFVGNNVAIAQLWRYLNNDPEKEAAADRALKREAFSIITKKTTAYGDTFTYDIMTYVLMSFDGQPAKIKLWEKPFDGHIFHIDLPGDRLTIPDFYCLTKVHHLGNNLLEIVYSPRGGSNDGYDNVLLLGVNKNKFCIVTEIQSVHEFDGPGEYGLYNLHLRLNGSNADSYQMIVQVRELLKSDNNTKNSYDRSSNYSLKFDKGRHIFFTDIEKLDAYLYEDIGCSETKKEHLTGLFPMINLGHYKYCFVNEIWYSVRKDTTGKLSMIAQPTSFKFR